MAIACNETTAFWYVQFHCQLLRHNLKIWKFKNIFVGFIYSSKQCLNCLLIEFNTLAPSWFRGFSEKKRLNTRGFAQEFLRFGILYRSGKSLKRCGKSSSLHSKKIFLLGGCVFFVSDVMSRGLFGHLGPLCLALGANHLVVVFRWSFYWKLGYNPSLLILWMTCWGFGFKSCDVS